MTELAKNKEQAARKAVFLKEFGGISNATKLLEYTSNKSVYNLIDKGLTQKSIERLVYLGYKKLVKRLKSASSQ